MRRTIRNIELPPDFSQRLLDNEIELKLSATPSKEVIANLIELYTYGVEYYESIKSYKYLYFQTKMKELFNGGSTLEMINKKTEVQESQESPVQKKMKSDKEEEKMQAFKIKQQQQKMLNEIVQKTSYTITSSQTKDILKNTEEKQAQVSKVINQQLETQNRSLEEKLKQRKARTLFAKSMSSIELFETPTRDSLFDNEIIDKKNGTAPNRGTIRQPIKVNFESFIHQNEESEEGDDETTRKRKTSTFSTKRAQSIDDLSLGDEVIQF